VCWAGTGRAVLSPAPLSWLAAAYLRCASDRFLLTNANTSCTIKLPASLRSENCSPSARNAVRVPFGISVRLRRTPHSDHDPLYRLHQWQANLRVLGVTETKTIPYVPNFRIPLSND
jgi:hypothetical protein